jgi:hypothetical protein
MSVKSESTSKTLHELNDDFAGRMNTAGFNGSKLIEIHRRNRPYVWSHKMQLDFLDSILKGYYIPPIICCAKNNKLYVMEGGNRITTIRRIMNNEVRALTDAERFKVSIYSVSRVTMYNLTSKQEREMFRRLNKSIKVSDGQLYAMSEDDSLLVQEAMAFLESVDYPLRARITDVFCDTVGKDNDGRVLLANTVAIMSGALYGVQYITKSFARQEERVESAEPIDRGRFVNYFSIILSIFEQANSEESLADKTKKKKQFTVGNILGAMLYDILTAEDMDPIFEKWCTYIVMVRRGVEGASDAIEIKGAQNINPDKLKKKCYRVEVFVRENRLVGDEELKQVKHSYVELASDEDEEEDEEEEDVTEVEN